MFALCNNWPSTFRVIDRYMLVARTEIFTVIVPYYAAPFSAQFILAFRGTHRITIHARTWNAPGREVERASAFYYVSMIMRHIY